MVGSFHSKINNKFQQPFFNEDNTLHFLFLHSREFPRVTNINTSKKNCPRQQIILYLNWAMLHYYRSSTESTFDKVTAKDFNINPKECINRLICCECRTLEKTWVFASFISSAEKPNRETIEKTTKAQNREISRKPLRESRTVCLSCLASQDENEYTKSTTYST